MPEHSFPDAAARASLSRGISNEAIYRMVENAIKARCDRRDGMLIDVGCGSAGLWQFLAGLFSNYIGVDAVKYEMFPEDGRFCKAELNTEAVGLPDRSADVVASVETIEHVENPRALVRELVRLAKPGGWIVITTPNQLAWASLACLVLKREFQGFQEGGEGGYPTHISALLEIDLVRIARENALTEIAIVYTNSGRIPFTGRHWPAMWPFRGRRFSDNLMVVARKPAA
jgi:2-polyprenyl-3-methyl-5-hydroxy-6-metoxy-1,4-benzoquinol methylase